MLMKQVMVNTYDQLQPDFYKTLKLMNFEELINTAFIQQCLASSFTH